MNFFNNKCLLCLLHNKNMKNVLSEDNDGILVEEKLKYILPEDNITLWYNKIVNYKPLTLKHICIDCLNDLNHVYKFKQKCFKRLKSLNDYIEETIGEQLIHQNEDRILPENITNRAVQSIKIEVLSAVDEVREYINTEKVVIKTEQKYIQDITLGKGTQINENIIEQESNTNRNNVEEDLHTNRNHLEEETHTNRNNLEEVIVKGEPNLNEEIDIKEDPLLPKESYSEDISDVETTMNAGHISQATSNENLTKKSHKCNVCQKLYSSKNILSRHKIIHTGLKPYQCDMCGKAFNLKSSLTDHRRIHTGEKPYKCDVCGKAFSQQTSLVTHKRLHTGEKPFVCESCPYKCNTSTQLNLHIQRRHTSKLSASATPYECHECDTAFTSKSQLMEHNRTHTKKSCECEFCPFKCETKSELKSHVKERHSFKTAKRYKCVVCGTSFRSPSHLVRHNRSHTGDKPYGCELCAYRCIRNSDMKAHIRRKHTGTNNKELITINNDVV